MTAPNDTHGEPSGVAPVASGPPDDNAPFDDHAPLDDSPTSVALLQGADGPTITAREVAVQLAHHEPDEPSGAVHVVGAKGSATGWVVRALLSEQSNTDTQSTIVCVAKDNDTAVSLAADLHFITGVTAHLFEAPESSPYAEINPDRRAQRSRLALLHRLIRGEDVQLIVLGAHALVRRVLPPPLLDAYTFQLTVDEPMPFEQVTSTLAASGYLRVPLVEDAGSFAVRGAILDVWPSGAPQPVRVDFFGDDVERINVFDPATQRSGAEVSSVWVPPARELIRNDETMTLAERRVREACGAVNWPSRKTRLLLEDMRAGRLLLGEDGWLPAVADLVPLWSYLPDESLVVIEEPEAVFSAVYDALGRAEQDENEKRAEPHMPLSAFYLQGSDVCEELHGRRVLALHSSKVVGRVSGDDPAAEPDEPDKVVCDLGTIDFETPSLVTDDLSGLQREVKAARTDGGKAGTLTPLVRRVVAWHEAGLRVMVVARAAVQADRIGQLLEHRGLDTALHGVADVDEHLSTGVFDERVHVLVGDLARGLIAPVEGIVILTEEEIFGHRKRRKRRRAKSSSIRRSFSEDLRNLTPGDLVVHKKHGIGRYQGLVHKQVGKAIVDMVQIAYQDNDKLFLPVYRLNQIQRHAGEEAPTKLDRLGGKTFERTKKRVGKAVQKMAEDLLRLYAERRTVLVEPVGDEDDDYRAFEATFPFEETDDQAAAIDDVLGDLHKFEPMDRLVCGDVGFGKTEVAIRAAFRIAAQGQQVAVLCPTTVLAQQHLRSFRDRLESYALNVQGLSRFQSKSQQADVVRGVSKGTVDIVVGTHRLLSKDVHFKSLGLLVVDEEQRFGVTHKERIKQLKTSVNVLTLTATPIPRTLQLAVSGLRDISLIRTPPVDRRAIRTMVTRDDPSVLREAVRRELSRGGQVFYVHNRIEALYERAARLQELVPDARIVVAHGQMPERALEKAMLAFVEGEFDVLASTSIIENGLDIPRANTIIIDQANRFGLSQLYQLRGRVGRSRERAYCYLVVPPRQYMSTDARSRIDALEAHTELGSGFQIASLDLQIRGGGDVLGAQQSGHVASVGFELFREMLENAVRHLQGKRVVHEIDPELNVDTAAWLPEAYVEDVSVRLALYKRLASAEQEREVDDLGIELEDMFGPPPEPARRYVRLMRLKVALRRLRVLSCDAQSKSVSVLLAEDHPLDVDKLIKKVQRSRGTWELRPDMRVMRRRRLKDKWKDGLDALDALVAQLEEMRATA